MVISYVIVVLCLVSPSAQFNGFNIGQGLGGTRVFDDAESAAVVQTGSSFPAQVSVISSEPDIGDGGGDGFGGILMMALPLLLLLGVLGGGTALTAPTAAAAALGSAASTCPVCTTTVQTTCPTTTAQCSPKAACPAGFVAVANADSNKCYLVGSATVASFADASSACAAVGGTVFQPGSTAELDLVRSTISATSTATYYIGYTSINNPALAPVGFYSGNGLPANAAAALPAFAPPGIECVSVGRTGGYGAVAGCVGNHNVLCEARLDKANCVCP